MAADIRVGLDLHIRNLFKLARNQILDCDDQGIFTKPSNAGTTTLLRKHQEQILLDYIYRNFKVPIRIMTSLSGEVVTREGDHELQFAFMPLEGISNVIAGLKVAGFAGLCQDPGAPLNIDEVAHAVVGSCYSGDYLQVDPQGKVIFNDNVIETPKEPNPRGSVIYVGMSEAKAPTTRKLSRLAKQNAPIRALGSPMTEALMVLTGRAEAMIYPEPSLNFVQIMSLGRIARALGAGFMTAEGDPFVTVSPSEDDLQTAILARSPAHATAILEWFD